jgi:hypothetical protein
VKTIPAASLLLGAYLAATPVNAAEFVHKSAVGAGPDIITITGQILKDDEKKFYDIVYGLKDVSIVVNSKGGWNQAAARIGVYIRHKNWETRLLNRSICNSACTLIFLAGAYRYMDPRTKLGFHSASMADSPRIRNEEGNKLIAKYLVWVGAPPQIIDLQPKADPCCLNYVGYAQAKAWGLLSDRPAKQQQALPTPEAQQQATTAPTPPPKPVITVPVRPTVPEPVPQQTPPIVQTQQPAAAAPNKTQERFEPGSNQASPAGAQGGNDGRAEGGAL